VILKGYSAFLKGRWKIFQKSFKLKKAEYKVVSQKITAI